jgi:hypothetical protein
MFHLSGKQQIDKTGQQAWNLRREWVVFQFELKIIAATDANKIVPPRAATGYFRVAARNQPLSSPRQVCLLPALIQSDTVSPVAAALENSVITHCSNKPALV